MVHYYLNILNLIYFPVISSHFSPEHEDDDKKMKEKESDELKPQKRERNLHSDRLFEVAAF